MLTAQPAGQFAGRREVIEEDEDSGEEAYSIVVGTWTVEIRGGAPRDVFAPELAPGDLLVYDQRTVHRGVANVSPNSRPILYLLFCRPWFREHINFGSTSLFDDDDEPPRPKKKHRS